MGCLPVPGSNGAMPPLLSQRDARVTHVSNEPVRNTHSRPNYAPRWAMMANRDEWDRISSLSPNSLRKPYWSEAARPRVFG